MILKLLLIAALCAPLACKRAEAPSAEVPEAGEKPPAAAAAGGRIAPGDSLYKALSREGLPDADVHAAIRALSAVFNPKSARPGHRYELTKSTGGGLEELTYWTDPIQYFSVKRGGSGFAATKGKAAVKESTVAIAGTVGSNLWESMVKQGVSPDLIFRFAEIFEWQIDFVSETRTGDGFKMAWKRMEAPGGVVEGEILAASYDGGGDKVTAVRYEGRYYQPDGKAMERQFLRAPLKFRAISSHFKKRRYHPVLRVYRPHHGIDYAAARGTPVSAIGDGVVTYRGWKGGNGNLVKIRHRNSPYTSAYAHLSRYAKGLRVGSSVKQGQVIGYVGSTGLSTAPHLHFGFEENGRPVNFLALKLPSARPITDRTELEKFNRVRDQVLPLLESAGGSASLSRAKPGSS